MDGKNETMSFLRPRDPSLSGEYLTFNSVRVNLAEAKFQKCLLKNPVPARMQTFLRIKETAEKFDALYEIEGDYIVCRAPGDILGKKYKFSKIFRSCCLQDELFNQVVKPKVFEFINGRSSSLFAYGASGSGKTFTIMGTTAQPGIIPRTFEYLFNSLPDVPDSVSFKLDAVDNIIFLNSAEQKKQKNIHDKLLGASVSTIDTQHVQTYKVMQERLSSEPSAIVEHQDELLLGVWVSFAEIYNENVYDLLKPHAHAKSREKLTIKMSNSRPYIKNLTTINITNGIDAYKILQYGLHNLQYASTSVNIHSSRSHSIFTIKLIQGSKKTNEFIVSYFNFCDLAGSERLKRTLNTGERLKESNSINTSLLVLGKCIRSILSSQKSKDNRPVPYRESKLTQLFQRSLCGLDDLTMIVNVNPEKNAYEETLHTLNFSAIAREIQMHKITKVVQQVKGDTLRNLDAEIEELQNIILNLQDEYNTREREHQERMQNIRPEMINECKGTLEKVNKNYEKEVERIEKYYEDRYQEEADSLKKIYEARASRANKNEIIVVDSSDEEEEFEEDEFKEVSALLDSEVIILSSSDDDDEEEKLEVKTNINESEFSKSLNKLEFTKEFKLSSAQILETQTNVDEVGDSESSSKLELTEQSELSSLLEPQHIEKHDDDNYVTNLTESAPILKTQSINEDEGSESLNKLELTENPKLSALLQAQCLQDCNDSYVAELTQSVPILEAHTNVVEVDGNKSLSKLELTEKSVLSSLLESHHIENRDDGSYVLNLMESVSILKAQSVNEDEGNKSLNKLELTEKPKLSALLQAQDCDNDYVAELTQSVPILKAHTNVAEVGGNESLCKLELTEKSALSSLHIERHDDVGYKLNLTESVSILKAQSVNEGEGSESLNKLKRTEEPKLSVFLQSPCTEDCDDSYVSEVTHSLPILEALTNVDEVDGSESLSKLELIEKSELSSLLEPQHIEKDDDDSYVTNLTKSVPILKVQSVNKDEDSESLNKLELSKNLYLSALLQTQCTEDCDVAKLTHSISIFEAQTNVDEVDGSESLSKLELIEKSELSSLLE